MFLLTSSASEFAHDDWFLLVHVLSFGVCLFRLGALKIKSGKNNLQPIHKRLLTRLKTRKC